MGMFTAVTVRTTIKTRWFYRKLTLAPTLYL